MIRTQISLTESQWERAHREAEARGISLAALVREALDRILDDQGEEERRARALASVGGFRSGRSDIAEHHDQALSESGW